MGIDPVKTNGNYFNGFIHEECGFKHVDMQHEQSKNPLTNNNFKIMGDIADGILDGTFDSITGEYLGEGKGYPRTQQSDHGDHYYEEPRNKEKFTKSTKAIRKELAILIKKTKELNSTTNENVIVNNCRKAINDKYGKGWREQF